MVIEVKYLDSSNKEKSKRYTIQNNTKYDEIVYYTITKNNSNHRIDIKFDNYNKDERNIKYMALEVKKSRLPKDVYDIVIDPGHGGADKGAKGGGYDEADLTLKYAKKVKQELEKLGLKVRITRDRNRK